MFEICRCFAAARKNGGKITKEKRRHAKRKSDVFFLLQDLIEQASCFLLACIEHMGISLRCRVDRAVT